MPGVYPYKRTLLSYSSSGAAPATVTGTGRRFVSTDATPDLANQKVRFVGRVARVGGTTPTVTAYIEFSIDNASWVPLAILNMSGSATEASVILPDGTNAQPYTRVRLEIGGSPRPQVSATVEMVCSDPFDLI